MLVAHICAKSFDDPSSRGRRDAYFLRDGSVSVIVSVFGASGRSGRAFISAASTAGLTLRLHYRSAPEDVAPELATVVVGALKDPTAVREVLRGSDASVILFGPRPSARDRVFSAKATTAIVDGMRTQAQRRLLCVTGAMMGALPSNLSLLSRLTTLVQRRLGNDDLDDDRAEQERIVRGSGLDWTLVKTPALTESASTETYLAALDLKIGKDSQLTRTSLARFILDELVAKQYLQKTVYVGSAAVSTR